MMSKKKKKMIVTVVAVLVSFVFMLSVVAGYFSSTGYSYQSNPFSSANSGSPASAPPAASTTQTPQTPAHAVPQK